MHHPGKAARIRKDSDKPAFLYNQHHREECVRVVTTGMKDFAGVTTSALEKKKPQGWSQLSGRRKPLVQQNVLCLLFYALFYFSLRAYHFR